MTAPATTEPDHMPVRYRYLLDHTALIDLLAAVIPAAHPDHPTLGTVLLRGNSGQLHAVATDMALLFHDYVPACRSMGDTDLPPVLLPIGAARDLLDVLQRSRFMATSSSNTSTVAVDVSVNTHTLLVVQLGGGALLQYDCLPADTPYAAWEQLFNAGEPYSTDALAVRPELFAALDQLTFDGVRFPAPVVATLRFRKFPGGDFFVYATIQARASFRGLLFVSKADQ